MPEGKLRIVLLCTDGRSSRILFHGLSPHVDTAAIIIENPVSARQLIRRRISKLGLANTAGQVLFILFNKLLVRLSAKRIRQLIAAYGLDESPLPEEISISVDSVNSEQTIALLRELKPDAVVVNGTRIISRGVLDAVESPFLNTHMGITPKYRGVHGGYWALANNDRENCGVTVHLVDTGIDTGGVLYQDTITTEDSDDFNTYPIHQTAKAIPLMKAALDDLSEGALSVKSGILPSGLWHHPTLFAYLKSRLAGTAK
ncbi:MAG: formyl transferase [Methylococcus sp.]|nr:formyl transferase [Methylococcus sp.]